MADAAPRNVPALLQVRGLNVYYGHSHALQGVEFTIHTGILAVVGRNGMGKTTLCKTIMGLVRASSGSIRFANNDELTRLNPAQIARLGIGYVPQGRRLWRSLTVDEHLQVTPSARKGAWTVERIYDTFPRLAERKNNAGGQLSGGEQQMLAISRALLANPRLLVMDEPTEGLAPLIVAQVEEMLVKLAEDGEMAVLVIEQNIGVACAVSENVAIMVNGRINRVIEASVSRRPRAAAAPARRRPARPRRYAARRDGGAGGRRRCTCAPAGRRIDAHLCLESDTADALVAAGAGRANRGDRRAPAPRASCRSRRRQRRRADIRAAGGERPAGRARRRNARHQGRGAALHPRLLMRAGVRTRLVDLSTSGKHSAADVSPHEVALQSSARCGRRVHSAIAARRSPRWRRRSRPGSRARAASPASFRPADRARRRWSTPAMRRLPGRRAEAHDLDRRVRRSRPLRRPSDIMMMYSVTDVQGLNAHLAPDAGECRAGDRRHGEGAARRRAREARGRAAQPERPAIGLTMFGVTTPCVQQVTAALEAEYDCLVFHATGTGGQSMEKLVDCGLLAGVIDITTTEVCDLLMGGVFPATEDRFGAIIRTRIPYVGSVGALDMVNFGPPRHRAGALSRPHCSIGTTRR